VEACLRRRQALSFELIDSSEGKSYRRPGCRRPSSFGGKFRREIVERFDAGSDAKIERF